MIRRLQSILAVTMIVAASTSTPAAPQDPKEEEGPSWRRVRAEFRRDWADRDAGVRCRAIEALARGAHPEAIDLLLDLLADEELGPAFRAHAGAALRAAVTGAGTERVRAAYDAKRTSPSVRAAILLACSERRTAAARSLLDRGLASDDPLLRTAAVAALGARPREGILAVLREPLADDDWRVRAAAIQAVADQGERAGVEALIPRLELETYERLRWEAYTALKRLSGQDFGFDEELWTLWAKGGESPRAGTREYASPRFYGLRVLGKRPVFVIDVSGSMLEPLNLTPRQRREIVAADDEKRLDWSEIETKLDLAKAELAAALRSLDDEVRFGLVFYADSVVPWRSELVRATPDEVQSAVRRVEGLGAGGHTNIHDALIAALALETSGARRGAEPLRTDQVLFLTDGRANRGELQDQGAIRTVHRELHLLSRVRFDCVGVGAHDRELLAGLAGDSGGRYVAVGK